MSFTSYSAAVTPSMQAYSKQSLCQKVQRGQNHEHEYQQQQEEQHPVLEPVQLHHMDTIPRYGVGKGSGEWYGVGTISRE